MRHEAHIDAEQFRLLVDSVRDYAIFILTPEGRVATWNAGAQAIKGYAAHEIIGEHFSRFYEAEAIARGWPEHELGIAKAEGRFEDEGWRVRKDGTKFWASVIITALFAPDGELRGFAKVTRDLTVRRRIEDLQRGERRTNEFLATLGHELRNPLATMRTALDIALRSQHDAATLQKSLGMFSRQMVYLTRIVDDLLDIARVTSGKVALKLDTIDLNELVHERIAAFRPLFAERNQDLLASLPEEPSPVRADPVRLAQVVSNLLANAHKFTNQGGQVSVTLRHESPHALLEISDNGIGIEPHLLRMIFEPFVQGSQGLDRTSGGLGLGLALVKRLVEMLGGTVAATSRGPGLGSTFSVRLPMLSIAPRRQQQTSPAMATAQLRVMVVEDNPDIARSMETLLQILDHEVEVAHDGVTALRRAPDFQPDVVLVDIGLPHLNGYQVARALRTIPALKDNLLVACTGYGREDDKQAAMQAGFDRHVIKPVSADTLIEILAVAQERIRTAGDPTA
jgi:PAS domain S-box-containing protein